MKKLPIGPFSQIRSHIYIFLTWIAPIYLKTSIHIAGTCFERNMSRNFNIGLSFCFMVCRIRDFDKNHKKSQRLPVF